MKKAIEVLMNERRLIEQALRPFESCAPAVREGLTTRFRPDAASVAEAASAASPCGHWAPPA